jgi:hypothetical protein
MLKIVEVHACHYPDGEYVVLQNQGTLTVPLRGYLLTSQDFLQLDPYNVSNAMYVFRAEATIKPYGRVVLFTGAGYDGWQPTTDGRQCYVAYWGREETVWSRCETVHLLRPESSLRVVGSPMRQAAGVA